MNNKTNNLESIWKILPRRIRESLIAQIPDAERLQEIRLRAGQEVLFYCGGQEYTLKPEECNRITPEEIQEKYGMTRVAIRSQVYRNNIPSKKEHGQIFYSKLHFDLSKSSEQESKAEYYTVKEAMEKFKLSRDSVYGILQFHQINREKNGRFVRFLKVEFDRVMGVRK